MLAGLSYRRILNQVRRCAAVLLILLAASPFTAPFSTCDLVALHGDSATIPQDSQGTLFKASTDSDNAPVLLADAASTIPLFAHVRTEALAPAPLPHVLRLLTRSLRI